MKHLEKFKTPNGEMEALSFKFPKKLSELKNTGMQVYHDIQRKSTTKISNMLSALHFDY